MQLAQQIDQRRKHKTEQDGDRDWKQHFLAEIKGGNHNHSNRECSQGVQARPDSSIDDRR